MTAKKTHKFGGQKAKRKRSAVLVTSGDAYDILCSDGYTSLDKNPEIMTACRKIAELIGSITIHLMENTEQGDKRIVNELSRMLDITPCRLMTRKTFIETIVMNLLLYGNGNAIVKVQTRDGYLMDMEPIAGSRVGFVDACNTYKITIDGSEYNPDEVLHFVFNPDKNYPYRGRGVSAQIRDVADNLKQAQTTKKGFLESKWKPSLIIKVDGIADEFSSQTGRNNLLNEYIEMGEAGKPWVIPAEQFQIEQVKPLTLSDLAIADTVKLDKQTVAAMLGVPPFLLGVGEYNTEEWNTFINTTIKSIVTGLQQEMTRKLIYSPNWYVRFNVISLMDWDIEKIASVFCQLSDRGYVTGNEVRDKINLSPREGLDELRILENYIPYEKSGDQKKLKQKGDKK